MASETNFLTEEMRAQAIGIASEPVGLDVEKGHVRRFAEAVGDANPLWSDEAAARMTRYGGIIAPPTFLRSLRVELPQPPFEIPFTRVLDGGSEWEHFEPVRVGDRITAVVRIADIYERGGRMGTMLFVIAETTYTNQLGEVVATQRNTGIRY